MNDGEPIPCSVNNCPLTATHVEEGVSANWRFSVFYCAEHARELAKGTPLGYAGLDPSRLRVRSLHDEAPLTIPLLPAIGP